MTKAAIEEPVKLLWSGGWDSTFRLLEIVLIEKKPVQPYYFIAPHHRKSTTNEIKAQEKIRKALAEHYPTTSELISPTIQINTSAVKADEAITAAHRIASQEMHLGRQYEWMARYCKQHQIFDMELCVQKYVEPGRPTRFSPFLEKDNDSSLFVYKSDLKDKPEYVVYQYFHYPVLDRSKEDMKDIAEEKGWMAIMKMTWFCHTPFFGKIPCGVCVPCQQAIGDGFGWRLPIYTRYLHKIWDTAPIRFLRKVLRPFRHMLARKKTSGSERKNK